jgi:alpha-galactosidase
MATGVRMNGRTLAAVGIAAPALQPQQLVLIRTRRV